MRKPTLLISCALLALAAVSAIAVEAEEKASTLEQNLIDFQASYYDGCVKGQKSLGKPENYQAAFCTCMLSVLREMPEADLKIFVQRVTADPSAATDPVFLEKLQKMGAADCALVGQFDDTKALSKEELSRLRDPKVFDGFSIRLPRGFLASPVQQQGTGRIFSFVRFHGDLETSAAIQVSLIDVNQPPPRAPTANDRQQLLAMFLKEIGDKRTDWTLSEPSEVVIGDLVFAAADWAGKLEGKAMQGTLYAAITNSKLVMLFAQDVQPYAGDTIPLAKEVFRTFSLQ